jgi:LDH2 family malate/lactate/ureidoglycolate dehydrogenase
LVIPRNRNGAERREVKPDPTSEPNIPADRLRSFCEELLTALGLKEGDASQVADTLIEADLRGVHSHGINLVSLYFNRVRTGQIRTNSKWSIVEDRGSTVLMDGGLGFGQIVGVSAADLSVSRAKKHGVAAVSVRELTHLGALGYYTLRAASAGCISLVVQNGPPFVPPFGGVTGMFSTNPFSYAFPAAMESPVVFDIATTSVAGSKIVLAKKRGDSSIPEGWASDERGRPTTSTVDASIDHLQWFGGHKGYGIAFFVEVMAGVLANSSFGRTDHSESTTIGKDRVAKGALFLAIDPASFPDGDGFGSRMDALIRDVQSSEPADGFDRVLVPGEIERRLRERRLVEGIPVSRALIDELAGFADSLQVPPLEVAF